MKWWVNFYNNLARPFVIKNVILKYAIVQELFH